MKTACGTQHDGDPRSGLQVPLDCKLTLQDAIIKSVMRAALDVDEKTATKLRELARASGMSVDQLLAIYVPGLAPSQPNVDGRSDPLAAFEEWAESFSQDAPPLSDDAISRTSVYRDR